jgi:hypothetical protein
MDKITDIQLADLRSRCMLAVSKGYDVARAEDYMRMLAAETGTKLLHGTPTASDLLQAVNAIIERRARGPKVEAPTPASQKPTVVPPVTEPEPEPEVEAKPESDDLDSFFDEKPTSVETPKGKSKKGKK